MALELAPGKTRIGWIGTGVMGSSMCEHLIAAGYAATVFNRTPDKARPLVEKGAKLADSPKAVAAASDVVFTIVGYPHDVREVTLGADGTLAGACLDMAGAVRNAVRLLGTPLPAALRMASLHPAEFLGLGHVLGRLAPGCRADIVAFDPADISVIETWVAGQASAES